MLSTEGQMRDHMGTALLIPAPPPSPCPIGDRGYDSRPSSRSREVPIPHGRMLCRQPHRVGTLFGTRREWRRIATRRDRCSGTVHPSIRIAATIVSWPT